MAKILFLVRDSDLHSSFVEFDLSLLKDSNHSVTVQTYTRIPRNPFKFLKNTYLSWKSARNHNYIFSWWLTNWYPAFISYLSRRPLFVVAAGFDTTKDDQLDYGGFNSPKLTRYIRYSVKHAFRVLTMNASLSQQLEMNIGKKLANIHEVVAGFNANEWQLASQPRSGLLTIASNKKGDMTRHLVKGIDRFIEAARMCSRYNFTLLGYTREILQKIESNLPENLIVIDYLPWEDLKKLYQTTKCYCQFSRHEGQPYTVCEAILSGCIVLGSNVNGIPTAVKDQNFLHDFLTESIDRLYQKISSIMNAEYSPYELIEYRNHVLTHFSKEIRQKQINDAFAEFLL